MPCMPQSIGDQAALAMLQDFPASFPSNMISKHTRKPSFLLSLDKKLRKTMAVLVDETTNE